MSTEACEKDTTQVLQQVWAATLTDRSTFVDRLTDHVHNAPQGLAAYWNLQPGHRGELRGECQRTDLDFRAQESPVRFGRRTKTARGSA